VDFLCGPCIENKHYFDSAISVMRYGDSSKKIIHKLKYSDKSHVAKNIARLMHIKMKNKIEDVDVIIPVPMHGRKMRKRLYNQSALIAGHLSKLSNIPFIANCLIKTRHHAPQTGLRRQLRKDNVKNSFSINKSYLSDIHNKNILLVDDVYTTGATVDECSKILKQSYCNKVKVITFARVV
jgi:ComF family protein